VKRPAKDSIRRFLSAEYTNHGSKYIEYLFGSKAAGLFTRLPNIKAIDLISISLAGLFKQTFLKNSYFKISRYESGSQDNRKSNFILKPIFF